VYRDENLIVTGMATGTRSSGGTRTRQRTNPRSRSATTSACRAVLAACLLLKQSVGGKHANPLQTWGNLGKPYTLDDAQRRILRASAEPLQRDENCSPGRTAGWKCR
jgi:xylan 1,4-beta-xylosidase